MKKYIRVLPEIIVGLGDNTTFNNNGPNKKAVHLHIEIENWLGDDLLWNFPEVIITEKLKNDLSEKSFSGFTIENMELTKDIYFEDNYELVIPLPELYWMKINGVIGEDDSYIENGELFLSKRFFEYLNKNFNLRNLEVNPEKPQLTDFIKSLVAQVQNKDSKTYIYQDGSRFYKDEDGNLIEEN